MSDNPKRQAYMRQVEELASRGFRPAGLLTRGYSSTEPAGILLARPEEPALLVGVTFAGKVLWLHPDEEVKA